VGLSSTIQRVGFVGRLSVRKTRIMGDYAATTITSMRR